MLSNNSVLSGAISFVSLKIEVCVCPCPRQGLRVHYPSQTAAPSRGFPDFLLRAPSASVTQPESGSTTELSESDDEEEQEGHGEEEGMLAAVEPVDPAPPDRPRLHASAQHALPREASPSSECQQCVAYRAVCCSSAVCHVSAVFRLQVSCRWGQVGR